MNKELLTEYAKLIVKKGVNVNKGQVVVIRCPIEGYEFARLVVKAAYEAGAKDVIVDYNDTENTRNKYIYTPVEELKKVLDYVKCRCDYEINNNACYIALTSPNVNALAGVDVSKVKESQAARAKELKYYDDYRMKSIGQWCVVGISTPVWAKQVFNTLPVEEAVDKLWEAILKACHVSLEEDTIANWTNHADSITNHAKLLNDYDFKSLHFKNSLGTDLVVELAEKNVFAGGDEYTPSGIRFSPNIPTEEVFGMPHKTKVNGTVVSTKPLNYQGGLIKDFKLTFKDGKVVEYAAKEGKELLKSLLEFDEGSSYLGEVALISHDSPISNMGILFYNTLFDENASCHLALGAAYPMNTLDGVNLSEEELIKRGCNISNTHVDFMFGSKCMDVVGTKKDGTKVQIFKNGNFVI